MSDDSGGDDIPAWFMTYSDVITLLMTFFILLLTFATTEPEKFERVSVSLMGSDSATGISGIQHDGMEKDSWVKRIRSRAARIALQGAEMPPIVEETSSSPKGPGLRATNEEEAKIDIMRTYTFEMKIEEILNPSNELTDRGIELAKKLSAPLRKLPVHCSLEVGTPDNARVVVAFAEFLMHTVQVRPGQVGIACSQDLPSDTVRIVLERYEVGNGQKKAT